MRIWTSLRFASYRRKSRRRGYAILSPAGERRRYRTDPIPTLTSQNYDTETLLVVATVLRQLPHLINLAILPLSSAVASPRWQPSLWLRPEHFHAAAIPRSSVVGLPSCAVAVWTPAWSPVSPKSATRPRGCFCACRNVRRKRTKRTKSGSGSRLPVRNGTICLPTRSLLARVPFVIRSPLSAGLG